MLKIDRFSIIRHVNNILKDATTKSTVANFATVQPTCAKNAQTQVEGNRKVTSHIKLYNLEIILAVGYRAKSNRINKFKIGLMKKLNELNDKSNVGKALNKANNYEIVKFESVDITIDINVSPNEDTVWLTQNDLAILFGTSIPNISMHIMNIFDSNELEKNSVIKKSLTTAQDGKTYNTTYYNTKGISLI